MKKIILGLLAVFIVGSAMAELRLTSLDKISEEIRVGEALDTYGITHTVFYAPILSYSHNDIQYINLNGGWSIENRNSHGNPNFSLSARFDNLLGYHNPKINLGFITLYPEIGGLFGYNTHTKMPIWAAFFSSRVKFGG